MLQLTQLHGFMAGGIRTQVTLTHIATSSVTSSGNISHPATIEPGDLLVYMGCALETGSADPPAMGNPSGYTSIREVNATPGGSNGMRARSAYKLADGSEDSSSINISTSAGTEAETACILQFRPNIAIGSVTVVDEEAELTTNDPAAQTLPSAGAEPVSLHVAFYYGSGGVDPRSYSPAETAEVQLTGEGIGAVSGGWVKYKIFNPPDTAVQVTANMDDEGINALMSFMLLCEPA
jgi:hypothetical protein